MEPFQIGRTFSRAFTLVGATWKSVGAYLLIITVANSLLQVWYYGQAFGGAGASREEYASAMLASFSSGTYWIYLAIVLFLGTLQISGSMGGMVRASLGQQVTLGECFAEGLARLLPAFGLYVLWWLGATLGLMLLVVPGVILICMWSVSLPALISERIGVFAAFGRSRYLTRGTRGSIFVLLLVAVIAIYVVIASVMAGILGASVMTMGQTFATAPWTALVGIPTGLITSLMLNALLASIYVETLTIKGEGPTGHLEAVFG